MFSSTIQIPRVHTADFWMCRVDFSNQEVLEKLKQELSLEELTAALRYRFVEDQVRSITARAALKKLCGAYLGFDSREVRFLKTSSGKLFLENPAFQFLHFNLSHSGHWVVLGFGLTPLGVDVETIDLKRDHESLEGAVLADPELEDISSLLGQERTDFFYKFWTAKEAYLKALGVGLGQELQSFWTEWEPSNQQGTICDTQSNSKNYFFHEVCVEKGYRAAFCAEGVNVIVPRIFSFEAF